MKDKFTGWHYVVLVGMVLGTIVALVKMGETLGAIVAAGLVILGVLGYNTAQGQANNQLANGRLTALQDQMAENDRRHAEEMARKDSQFSLERASLQAHIKDASDKAAAYAAQVQPEAKPEIFDVAGGR